jgi:hypothetical protein
MIDFWSSRSAFQQGTPMGPVHAAQAMIRTLPGEGGTLRTALARDYAPLRSFLLASADTGRAWSWLSWQAGKHWPLFMEAAAWQFRTPRENGSAQRPHAGDVLLALGRVKFFLDESSSPEQPPPPWRRRATSGRFSVWEQPTVVPMASGYRRYVVYAGGTEDKVVELVSEASRRSVLVVSVGERLAGEDAALLEGALFVHTDDEGVPGEIADAPAEPELDVDYRRPAPERIELSTDAGTAPALVLLSEAFHPWWRATVDGTPAPVLRAQLALMAVPVGAGPHRIELRFRRPLLVAAADVVTSLAWLTLLPLTIGGAIGRWKLNRRVGA